MYFYNKINFTWAKQKQRLKEEWKGMVHKATSGVR